MIEYTGDRKLFFVTEKMKKIFSIEDQSVINQIFKLESKI